MGDWANGLLRADRGRREQMRFDETMSKRVHLLCRVVSDGSSR